MADKETTTVDPRDAQIAELTSLVHKLSEAVANNGRAQSVDKPGKTAETKSIEQLMDEAEKIPVRIPSNPADKNKQILVVVNGFRSLVPIGVNVQVPRPIYEQLVSAGHIGAEPGDENLEPDWSVKAIQGDEA